MGAWLANLSAAERVLFGGFALIALAYALDALARRWHHESAGRWWLLAAAGGIGALIGAVHTPWGRPAASVILRFVLVPALCCVVLASVAVHVRARLGAKILVDLGKVRPRDATSLTMLSLFVLTPMLEAVSPEAPYRFEWVAVATALLVFVSFAMFGRSVATGDGIVQFPFLLRWDRIRSYEWGPVSTSRLSGRSGMSSS